MKRINCWGIYGDQSDLNDEYGKTWQNKYTLILNEFCLGSD